MSNPNVQPYAPDPTAPPGTAPVDGAGGERGTSAFPGNADYDHFGRRRSSSTAAPGPKVGTSYFTVDAKTSPDTEGRAAVMGVRESAGSHAATASLTIAVTSSNDTPAANASVTLTATATETADATPTGTVTFKDGASTIGTGTFNGSGVATYTHSAGFAAGAHSITAVYAGDSNFAASTSPVKTVTAS